MTGIEWVKSQLEKNFRRSVKDSEDFSRFFKTLVLESHDGGKNDAARSPQRAAAQLR